MTDMPQMIALYNGNVRRRCGAGDCRRRLVQRNEHNCD